MVYWPVMLDNAAGAPLVLVGYGYRREFDLHGCGALAVIDRFEQLLELR